MASQPYSRPALPAVPPPSINEPQDILVIDSPQAMVLERAGLHKMAAAHQLCGSIRSLGCLEPGHSIRAVEVHHCNQAFCDQDAARLADETAARWQQRWQQWLAQVCDVNGASRPQTNFLFTAIKRVVSATCTASDVSVMRVQAVKAIVEADKAKKKAGERDPSDICDGPVASFIPGFDDGRLEIRIMLPYQVKLTNAEVAALFPGDEVRVCQPYMSQLEGYFRHQLLEPILPADPAERGRQQVFFHGMRRLRASVISGLEKKSTGGSSTGSELSTMENEPIVDTPRKAMGGGRKARKCPRCGKELVPIGPWYKPSATQHPPPPPS